MEHHALNVESKDKHATTTEIAARDGACRCSWGAGTGVGRLITHWLDSGVHAPRGMAASPSRRAHPWPSYDTGRVTVLVAPDLAACGIHVDDLDLVVNTPSDPPPASRCVRRGW